MTDHHVHCPCHQLSLRVLCANCGYALLPAASYCPDCTAGDYRHSDFVLTTRLPTDDDCRCEQIDEGIRDREMRL